MEHNSTSLRRHALTLREPDKATEELGYSLGIQAYIWGFAPWSTEQARRAMTEAQVPGRARVPINSFHFATELSAPDSTGLPAPNTDTLDAVAWLDLRRGPLLFSVPEIKGRYYAFQLVDAYTDTFAYVGLRTHGTAARTIVITGPGWVGRVPVGIERIKASTPDVCIYGRIGVVGAADVPNVTAIQQKLNLVPLATYQTPYAPSSEAFIEPKRYEGSLAFFEELGDVMVRNPTRPQDEGLVSAFSFIGLHKNYGFDATALNAYIRRGLKRAIPAARSIINEQARIAGTLINGWSLFGDEHFGPGYIFRAVVAYIAPFVGLFTNAPGEAFYPQAFLDGDGEPLDASKHEYTLNFERGLLPPVDGFWSITTYDRTSFGLLPNPINRYSIGDRTSGLKYNADGSLTIRVQHESPGDHEQANWLPAPRGPMYVTLRMYIPKREVLTREWVPPALKKRN